MGKIDKLTRKDLIITIVGAIIVGIIASYSLGFFKYGFVLPTIYKGNDEFSVYAQVKEISQEGWVWSTDRLGAPYTHDSLSFPAHSLKIIEYLCISFFLLFTKNIVVALNCEILLIFILCYVSAYLVLRKMNLKYAFAFAGAVLFALNPYIFSRNIVHLFLSSCYFVPVSFYLCYLCFFDENYLRFNKSFFSWKTLVYILLCIGVAINGTAYYPFFTCFFLVVTAFIKLINTKKIRSILPMVKTCVLICGFMVVTLLPAISYKHNNPGVKSIKRSFIDLDTFGLRISQFFIPTSTHGLKPLDKLLKLNKDMYTVNENVSSYLGIFGCIGFILGIVIAFKFIKDNKHSEELKLVSFYNLAAILFLSAGGIFPLMAAITNVTEIRGLNRVSIYMSFCCMFILFMSLQSLYEDKSKSHKFISKIVYPVLALVLIIGVIDQCGVVLKKSESSKKKMNTYLASQERWEIDEEFVGEIEDSLEPGDMVFQLPYHKYPEQGKVNNMRDYQLILGYLHSDTLKWSYAGFNGSDGDRWNEVVGNVDYPTMLNIITSSGFKGLYIDRSAYTDNEFNKMVDELNELIGYEPSCSEDDRLYFYNLYPYIENNSDLISDEAYTLEDLEYLPYEDGEVIDFSKDKFNALKFVKDGIASPDENFTWTLGDKVEMKLLYSDANSSSNKSNKFQGELQVAGIFGSEQTVKIYVNDELVCEKVIYGGNIIEFEGDIPKSGKVDITLELPDCVSPTELELSPDDRKLAIAIAKIVLTNE